MAYEVARVHGLILSNIQEGVKLPAEGWPLSESSIQMPTRLSPDTPLYDFPSDSIQWSESSHSSSLESSTETETESDDEDDFIAGLAEQIAHSMLDDDKCNNAAVPGESFHLNGSTEESHLHGRTSLVPQKALSPQSSWSPSSVSASWSDSVSSSKQSSQVSSPPSTPFNSEGDAWDLLNAAAGEVERLQMIEERKAIQKLSVSFVPETVKQCGHASQQPMAGRLVPYPLQPSKPPNCIVGSRLSGPVPSSRDRLAAGPQANAQKGWSRPREDDRKVCTNSSAQQRLPRNEAVSWTQRRSSNQYKGAVNQKVGRPNYGYGHPRASGKTVDNMGVSQRPGVQGVNGGSGMRAVFLGSTGSGRESGGTGVFLPRCVGTGSDQRRKPSCSTVLLPSRIVQVLKLNVEDMRTHPAPLPATSSHARNDYSGTMRNPPHMYMMELTAGTGKHDGGNLPSYPRKTQTPQIVQTEPVEYSLPTEWTY